MRETSIQKHFQSWRKYTSGEASPVSSFNYILKRTRENRKDSTPCRETGCFFFFMAERWQHVFTEWKKEQIWEGWSSVKVMPKFFIFFKENDFFSLKWIWSAQQHLLAREQLNTEIVVAAQLEWRHQASTLLQTAEINETWCMFLNF